MTIFDPHLWYNYKMRICDCSFCRIRRNPRRRSNRSKQTAIRKAKAQELCRDTGLTYRAIAKKVKSSPNSVSRWCKGVGKKRVRGWDNFTKGQDKFIIANYGKMSQKDFLGQFKEQFKKSITYQQVKSRVQTLRKHGEKIQVINYNYLQARAKYDPITERIRKQLLSTEPISILKIVGEKNYSSFYNFFVRNEPKLQALVEEHNESIYGLTDNQIEEVEELCKSISNEAIAKKINKPRSLFRIENLCAPIRAEIKASQHEQVIEFCKTTDWNWTQIGEAVEPPVTSGTAKVWCTDAGIEREVIKEEELCAICKDRDIRIRFNTTHLRASHGLSRKEYLLKHTRWPEVDWFLTDAELARQYGTTGVTVGVIRKTLGIRKSSNQFLTQVECGSVPCNLLEAQFDLYLHCNNIPHQCQVPVKGSEIDTGVPYRADFYLIDQDVYIETTGFLNYDSEGKVKTVNVSSMADAYFRSFRAKNRVYKQLVKEGLINKVRWVFSTEIKRLYDTISPKCDFKLIPSYYSPQQQFLDLLQGSNYPLSGNDYQDLNSAHQGTSRRHLHELERAGLIKRIPVEGKTYFYHLPSYITPFSRQDKLLYYLSYFGGQTDPIRIQDYCDIMGVSIPTASKDLNAWARKGIIKSFNKAAYLRVYHLPNYTGNKIRKNQILRHMRDYGDWMDREELGEVFSSSEGVLLVDLDNLVKEGRLEDSKKAKRKRVFRFVKMRASWSLL